MARANKSSSSRSKTASRKTRSTSSQSCPMGYCVRCRKMQQMKGCTNATSSNGRNMVKGNCTSCDTKMNKFV